MPSVERGLPQDGPAPAPHESAEMRIGVNNTPYTLLHYYGMHGMHAQTAARDDAFAACT